MDTINSKSIDLEKIHENNILDSSNNSKEIRKNILNLVCEYFKSTHAIKPFLAGKSLIPVSGKVFDENELETLVASSLDFWLTAGRFNDEFEKQLAKIIGINFVLTTNSGSSANLLAISALTSDRLEDKALKPNDEIITVAAGFPTTINPILQNNLVPVFVDVDLDTYAVNVEQLEKAITKKTKAIILAHTLGNPFNIDKVKSLSTQNDLWFIEDCCDALGSTYRNIPVGTFGDIATLSFYPAHQITMGEGGAVLTNNSKLKMIIESFRDWGRDCFCAPGKNNTCGKRFDWKLGDLPYGYDHKYTYSHTGYNLKITEMQAAIGLAQLGKLNNFISIRKMNFKFLRDNLDFLSKYVILPEPTPNSDPSWFGFPMTVRDDAPFSRDDIISFLATKMIDTRPLFAGNITKQPYFSGKLFKVYENLQNTDRIMNNSFWIGVYPGLNEEMLQYVVNQFHEFIKQFTNQ
jgi:CDP-6-deoxy-D-xylo-4-hexulose-3-dehydrase